MRGRLNIVVSGGTGSGKTTTLNVLSAFIPDDERIVTIEDAAELQLHQAHVVSPRVATREHRGPGRRSRIRDLVRNALRMRPDRIVVGEVRDGAALDMLQAMNTGHDGSITTLHANSPRDALARLETMVLMAGMDLPVRAIREQVASAIDLIVHQTRLRDGSRRVTHVTEVVGMESDVVTTPGRLPLRLRPGHGRTRALPGRAAAHRPPPEVHRAPPGRRHRARRRAVRGGGRGMNATFLGGALAASVFVLVYVLVASMRAGLAAGVPVPGRSASLQVQLDRNAGSPLTSAALQAADRLIPEARKGRTETLLQVAGLPFKPAEWLLLRASGAVVLAVVCALVSSVPLTVAALVAGAFLAFGYPRLRARRRRARFAEDLPDALQLVSGSLRAGFSLGTALEAAARHAREPLAGELSRVLAMTRLGSGLEDGLDDVARRMASQDFAWVALAIRVQAEVGGNLAEILDTTVETLRERFHLKGQIRALAAEGRLSAYILLALPFLISGWVAWRNPGYAQLLWTTSMGLAMLAGAAVLMVVGCFWIRAVIRVDIS